MEGWQEARRRRGGGSSLGEGKGVVSGMGVGDCAGDGAFRLGLWIER